MTTARNAILDRLRHATANGGPPTPAPAPLIPGRALGDPAALVEAFLARVHAAAGTAERVMPTEVAPAVARWLDGLGGTLDVVTSLDSPLRDGEAGLRVRQGRPTPEDHTAVVPALVGVAETGSVVIDATEDRPGLLSFLPDNHIVLVKHSDVVGSLDAALQRLRAGGMPSSAVFITGPSRTGDIEQTLQLGAHGPLRLHVLLVDDPA